MRKYIDIHSHIIFGADDGAETPDEAIELLKLDRDEGAYAVFATPHAEFMAASGQWTSFSPAPLFRRSRVLHCRHLKSLFLFAIITDNSQKYL